MSHYWELFNCVQCSTSDVTYNVDFCAEINISVEEIKNAIVSLDNDKSCGADGIDMSNI